MHGLVFDGRERPAQATRDEHREAVVVPQVVEFLVQFLEGHIASVARDADVDGVDPVAEACARADRSVRHASTTAYALPGTMLDGLFFGTATQGEAARLWRPRGRTARPGGRGRAGP